jgi:hypothetical protein
MAKQAPQTNNKILGALVRDGDNPDQNPVLQLLIAQQEQMAQTQRLLEANEAVLRDVKGEMAAIRQDIITEKKRADQALQAAIAQVYTTLEQQPKDPQTLAEMIKVTKQNATAKREKKRQRFLERINNGPKGEIYVHEEEPIILIINAVRCVLRPGKNVNIPQRFIQEYQRRQEMAIRAKEFQRQLEVKDGLTIEQQLNSYGHVERIRAQNRTMDATLYTPKADVVANYSPKSWSESSGFDGDLGGHVEYNPSES